MPERIEYVEADNALKDEITRTWQSNAGEFVHIEDGYSIVALAGGKPIAVISACAQPLLEPFADASEEFIDILEVQEAYRRQGIGSTLVGMVISCAAERNATQVRAWSESKRYEALMLWRRLGFALCPVKYRNGDHEEHGFQVVKRL